MHAERRCRPGDPGRRGREPGDRPHLLDRSDTGRVQRDDLAVVPDLRVVQPLLAGAQQLVGDVRLGAQADVPLGERAGAERLPDRVLPGLRVIGGRELGGACVARVREQVLDPHGPHDGLSLVRQHRGEEDEPPVLRARHVRVAARGHALAAPAIAAALHRRSDRAVLPLPRHRAEVVHRGDTVEERYLDLLSAARPPAGDERGDDAGRREVAAAGARDRRVDEDRPRSVAEDTALAEVEGAGLGLDDVLVRLDVPVGAGRAEPADRAVHERGVEPAQIVVGDAEALGDARCEGGDERVGRGGERAGLRPSVRGAQVGDDALLAAVEHERGGGVAQPQPVALRGLHLEHAGTVVGEQHPGERRGVAARAELEHGEAVENRLCHLCSRCRPGHRMEPRKRGRGNDTSTSLYDNLRAEVSS